MKVIPEGMDQVYGAVSSTWFRVTRLQYYKRNKSG